MKKKAAAAKQAAAASARLARAKRGEHRRIMGTRVKIMVRKQGLRLPPSRLSDTSAVGGANPFNVRASAELPLRFP